MPIPFKAVREASRRGARLRFQLRRGKKGMEGVRKLVTAYRGIGVPGKKRVGARKHGSMGEKIVIPDATWSRSGIHGKACSCKGG